MLVFVICMCLLGAATALSGRNWRSSKATVVRRTLLKGTVTKDVRGSCQLFMSSVADRTVSLTKDGKVMKTVLTPGPLSGKRVETGDILAVEFTASVKGSEKPFAKGEKEQFIVKDGSLIKGWDVGVSSMIVGEKASIICSPEYAYGSQGIKNVIPPNAEVEIQIKILAWLGNQLRPESLFQKDLDIDPFIASTPESIAAEYEEMQANKEDKYKGGIIQIYLNRLKNISFGFGGSGFFVSQSGEKAPWWLNPNLTFPLMITIVLAAFITVLGTGSVREKGDRSLDLEVAATMIQRDESSNLFS